MSDLYIVSSVISASKNLYRFSPTQWLEVLREDDQTICEHYFQFLRSAHLHKTVVSPQRDGFALFSGSSRLVLMSVYDEQELFVCHKSTLTKIYLFDLSTVGH